MKKSPLLFLLTALMPCLAAGQEPPSEDRITVNYLFLPEDDRFFRTVGDNESEIDKLLVFIDKYIDEIISGKAHVSVTGYAWELASRDANLDLASRRARRVKSYLIQKKALTNQNFRTSRIEGTEAQGAKVAVSVAVPLTGMDKPGTDIKVSVDHAERDGNTLMLTVKVETVNPGTDYVTLAVLLPPLGNGTGGKTAEELTALEVGAGDSAQAAKPKHLVISEPVVVEGPLIVNGPLIVEEVTTKSGTPAKEVLPIGEEMVLIDGSGTDMEPEVTVTRFIPVVEDTARLTRSWREPYRFSVRTNLVYWGALTPNVGFEWRLGRALGIKVDAGWSGWTWDNYIHKIRYVSPEVRFYLDNARRFYVGLGGNIASAEVRWDPLNKMLGTEEDMGYKGRFYGAGITVGYQARLTDVMSIDFNLGFGYTKFKFDNFRVADGQTHIINTGREKTLWAPTQAEVALVWRLGRDRR